MLSKRVLSEITSLHQPKFRKERGLFIVEGEKVVGELLRSSFTVKLIAALPEYLENLNATSTSFEIHEITQGELSRISALSTPNKVLAVVAMPEASHFDIPNHKGITLVLDGISDPGNLGTILRTADWFGVKHVICSENSVDCFNPKVVQSSMGSLFRIQVHYENLPAFLNTLKATNKFTIMGATLQGKNYVQGTFGNQPVIVIGSESHGISDEVIQLLDEQITIQKAEGSMAESLNASVACGILLQHFSKKA